MTRREYARKKADELDLLLSGPHSSEVIELFLAEVLERATLKDRIRQLETELSVLREENATLRKQNEELYQELAQREEFEV